MMVKAGREIITVNVGGCGINLGTSSLEQYCVEQGISCDGMKVKDTNSNQYEDKLNIFYRECADGTLKARSLFFDMDPYSINMARNIYRYNKIINKNYMVSGQKSSNNNWADAHYVGGKEIIDNITDKLRLAVDECDCIQGFIFNHSISKRIIKHCYYCYIS